MGDRAVIIMAENGVRHDVAVYLHWNGENAIELIEAALPRMRHGDASYSTARFIGCCHNEIDGNLSLGCFAVSPEENLVDINPGDAGVIVYDCSTGVITCIGGYLRDSGGINIGTPCGG